MRGDSANMLLGLALFYGTFAIPFGVFVMRSWSLRIRDD